MLQMLLIVPYGIETEAGCYYRQADGLLIVPYGIETDDGKNGRIQP